jgi:hypothetical protein
MQTDTEHVLEVRDLAVIRRTLVRAAVGHGSLQIEMAGLPALGGLAWIFSVGFVRTGHYRFILSDIWRPAADPPERTA